MNQDFIVFAIIALTVFYVAFGFVKNLKTKKVKSSCGGCTGCDLSRTQNNVAGCSPVKKFERRVVNS
ncbi:MAG: FeoB-associated Cys-rich membrane protein [Ignavibacteriales bacterium]|nr:MAG: FeoB-associated Cys-rich membrane protein [Ignavibacteriales bacterium]